uniref:Uncharacterized protein n=1 Tax=Magallana gigas TaxID=29159 RepID=A0A8W8JCH9_MAGGI
MPKVKSKNTPARPPTSRTPRPARKDAEPLNSAPTMVPTPPTAGPQHQEVAAPIQTEVVSTAAPIPTLISDTQDVQRLHISVSNPIPSHYYLPQIPVMAYTNISSASSSALTTVSYGREIDRMAEFAPWQGFSSL